VGGEDSNFQLISRRSETLTFRRKRIRETSGRNRVLYWAAKPKSVGKRKASSTLREKWGKEPAAGLPPPSEGKNEDGREGQRGKGALFKAKEKRCRRVGREEKGRKCSNGRGRSKIARVRAEKIKRN